MAASKSRDRHRNRRSHTYKAGRQYRELWCRTCQRWVHAYAEHRQHCEAPARRKVKADTKAALQAALVASLKESLARRQKEVA